MKRILFFISLLAITAAFFTSCSDDETKGNALLDPTSNAAQLAGTPGHLEGAIDATKSPFFLVYVGVDDFKSRNELAAEYRAMRQKYIRPILSSDEEKKEFAQKILDNIEKFEKMSNFLDFKRVVENKLGMTITEAAQMEVKSKASTELAAWGDYSEPPNNQTVYIDESNPAVRVINSLHCPSWGSSNASHSTHMEWTPGSPVNKWGRLHGSVQDYSTSSYTEALYMQPLYPANASSSGLEYVLNSGFTAPPGTASIVYANGSLYSTPSSYSSYNLIARIITRIYWYNIRKGDIDYDGDIDDDDAIRMANYFVGNYLDDPAYSLWAADWDGDGVVVDDLDDLFGISGARYWTL